MTWLQQLVSSFPDVYGLLLKEEGILHSSNIVLDFKAMFSKLSLRHVVAKFKTSKHFLSLTF